MKKVISVVVIAVLTAALLAGCGGANKYKDGTYEGQSKADERGNYGKVSITIESGKITKADYKGYLKDGSVKDENYGKTAGDENYQKAQKSVQGAAAYGPKLVETQDVSKVDAVSGATASHGQFKEAVDEALKKAAK